VDIYDAAGSQLCTECANVAWPRLCNQSVECLVLPGSANVATATDGSKPRFG